MAPNKNAIAQRRHPLYPSQVEKKQYMYRLETTNELWAKFVKENPEFTASIATPGKPYTAPTIFRTNAPWEMRKMHDEGCLCKSCESFHCLKRGTVGVCSVIDIISKRIEESSVESRRKATKDLTTLHRIKDILATPSKYDTIVECLQPCLSS